MNNIPAMKRSRPSSVMEPVVYVDSMASAHGEDQLDAEGKELKRGLRTWTFDPKTRKRLSLIHI